MCNGFRLSITSFLFAACLLMPVSHSIFAQNPDLEYMGSTLWNHPKAIEVVGDYAYCAMIQGLMIFDVTDVTNPLLVSKLYLEGSGNDIEISGSYAYIAAGYAGLNIVNISDVYNPILIGSCESPSEVGKVHLYDNYIYAFLRYEGLHIFDVTDPGNPFYITNIDPSADVLFIDGQYAFMDRSSLSNNFRIFDLADPLNPALIGSASIDSFSATAIYVQGNYAYAGSEKYSYSALYIIDITSMANPSVIGIFETDGCDNNLIVDGNYAYFCDGNQNIRIVDISNPETPSLAGTYNHTFYSIYDIFLEGNHLYFCPLLSGIRILNVSNPANPIMAGIYDFPDYQQFHAVKGNYAYTAGNESGLHAVDISNPYNPLVISTYDTPGYARDVVIEGYHAYLTDGTASWFYIFDVSDPESLSVVSTFVPGGGAVNLSGNYAYLGIGNDSLIAIDVSDPANPIQVGAVATPDYIYDIFISGNYAYLAITNVGMHIIDISNPAIPTISGYYTDSFHWNYRALFVEGEYAYITGGGGIGGIDRILLVIDVSDPANPTFVSDVILHDSYWGAGISIYGRFAYLGTYYRGMVIYDISDPVCPYEIFHYQTPMWVHNVVVSDSLLYMGTESGLLIFHYAMLAGCEYTVGDVNNSGTYNGLDITFGVAFFKGGPPPPYECECTAGNIWYVAGDVNGSCSYNGLDITYGVAYLKGGPDPIPCPDCPPN